MLLVIKGDLQRIKKGLFSIFSSISIHSDIILVLFQSLYFKIHLSFRVRKFGVALQPYKVYCNYCSLLVATSHFTASNHFVHWSLGRCCTVRSSMYLRAALFVLLTGSLARLAPLLGTSPGRGVCPAEAGVLVLHVSPFLRAWAINLQIRHVVNDLNIP